MKYIASSLSLNMLKRINMYAITRVRKVNSWEIPNDVISVVGRKNTANLISKVLGFKVAFNRVTLTISEDDVLYVAQYKGPRLPEGATVLPEGATITFFEVTFKENMCAGCSAHNCNSCGNMSWLQGI